MAIPASYVAAASGGIQSLSGLLAGARQNKLNRDFQDMQNRRDQINQNMLYLSQTKQARKNWELQNQYNSPVQQMNRMRQAGLSTQLMYGKGAENTAEAIHSTQGDAPNHPAPQVDMGYVPESLSGGIQTYNNVMTGRSIQAQTDNMYEQRQLMMQEEALKAAQTLNTIKDTEGKGFHLDISRDLYDQTIKRATLDNQNLEADLIKKRADTQYTLDANERARLLTSVNIKKTMQEILESKIRVAKSKQEIANLKQALIKLTNDTQFEAKLQKAGVVKGAGITANAASIITTFWDNLFGD